jgi:hypothetical protein
VVARRAPMRIPYFRIIRFTVARPGRGKKTRYVGVPVSILKI